MKSGFVVRSDEAGAGTGVVVVVSLLLEAGAGCWKVGLEVSLSARAFCFGTHCRGNSSHREGASWASLAGEPREKATEYIYFLETNNTLR